MKPSYVVSLSLGKDSTELLCGMLERGENVISAVYFDTGWEFPHMVNHLAQLEAYTGIKVVTLHPRLPFDVAFSDMEDTEGGRDGYGWPSFRRRWCTSMKRDAIKAYCNSLTWQGYSLPIVQCIGFAVDEPDRVAKYADKKSAPHQGYRFPLVEWGMTEAQALENCFKRGFTWGGLYNHFRRVSCFCCPLQGLDELQVLYTHYPKLWARMLEMESRLPENSLSRRYKHKNTVSDLNERFVKKGYRTKKVK